MSIRDVYNLLTRKVQGGIEGYNLIKKYEDPEAALKNSKEYLKNRKVKQLKRGSYLEDQYKAKRYLPGVGKYNVSRDLGEQKPKGKRHMSEKKTYLDQIMHEEKKKNIPAPGKYGVFNAIGQQSVFKHSSNRKMRTENEQKITYLNHAQYEGTLTPGVGEYDIERWKRSKTQTSLNRLNRDPQYWRKHHQEKEKMKIKNKEVKPDMATYHPIPSTYQLFESKAALSKSKERSRSKLASEPRFKKDGIGKQDLGPGKYNLNNVWQPKQKDKKSLLNIVSKGVPKSVYYH